MLIGAHVSTAGGLVKAHARGVELDCDAIQIFNQSPRMWKPTSWKEPDIAEFRSLMESGPIKSVIIHAVYLINLATKDREMRKKSLTSLSHALRMGDAIGADGVVVHPGSTLKEPLPASLKRVGQAIEQVLGESESCRLLLENTAGAGGTIGRSLEELYELVDLGGGSKRIGVCLDCCHMLASGFDIRTDAGLSQVMDDFESHLGLDRLACVPDGELGEAGLSAFLSEPRFEKLPALLEKIGDDVDKDKEQVATARRLREKGLARRKRRAAGR
jgi:deoxyribonuclease IV